VKKYFLMTINDLIPRTVISPQWMICSALALLIIPIKWYLSFFIAAAIHELGHLVMLKILRIPIEKIEIDIHGAVIKTTIMQPWQEMLCVSAGPIAGAATMIAVPVYPALAICALIQTVYNLLPFFPSDGSRILRCILEMLLPERTALLVLKVMVLITYIAVFGCLVHLLRFPKLGILPYICAVFLVINIASRKTPCKEACNNVQ